MKVKLFRRGKLVGIVNQNFHGVQRKVKPSVWNELEIEPLMITRDVQLRI